jgi:hypothetical protein
VYGILYCLLFLACESPACVPHFTSQHLLPNMVKLSSSVVMVWSSCLYRWPFVTFNVSGMGDCFWPLEHLRVCVCAPACIYVGQRHLSGSGKESFHLYFNTLRTGDANLRFLRFCITTVKDERRKSAFLTRAWFPCTSLHNTWSVSPNGPPGWMFKET